MSGHTEASLPVQTAVRLVNPSCEVHLVGNREAVRPGLSIHR